MKAAQILCRYWKGAESHSHFPLIKQTRVLENMLQKKPKHHLKHNSKFWKGSESHEILTNPKKDYKNFANNFSHKDISS